jgi:hypothetical protein
MAATERMNVCRGFCKSEGLMNAIEAAVQYWSQVFVEASLILHLFLLQRCEEGGDIEKFNLTFFTNLVQAVTR